MESRCPAAFHNGFAIGHGYLYVHAEPSPHVHCYQHGNSPGYEYCRPNADANTRDLPLPKAKSQRLVHHGMDGAGEELPVRWLLSVSISRRRAMMSPNW